MFSKASKSASRRSTPSIIGTDCTFTGDIVTAGEIQIDGRLEGDVRCSNLVIGEKGSIIGEINADMINVLGSVTGQINARTVVLAKTARILGDITHDSLSVETGAFVEGRFNRLSADPEKPTPTTESAVRASKSDDGADKAACATPPKVVLVGN